MRDRPVDMERIAKAYRGKNNSHVIAVDENGVVTPEARTYVYECLRFLEEGTDPITFALSHQGVSVMTASPDMCAHAAVLKESPHGKKNLHTTIVTPEMAAKVDVFILELLGVGGEGAPGIVKHGYGKGGPPPSVDDTVTATPEWIAYCKTVGGGLFYMDPVKTFTVRRYSPNLYYFISEYWCLTFVFPPHSTGGTLGPSGATPRTRPGISLKPWHGRSITTRGWRCRRSGIWRTPRGARTSCSTP